MNDRQESVDYLSLLEKMNPFLIIGFYGAVATLLVAGYSLPSYFLNEHEGRFAYLGQAIWTIEILVCVILLGLIMERMLNCLLLHLGRAWQLAVLIIRKRFYRWHTGYLMGRRSRSVIGIITAILYPIAIMLTNLKYRRVITIGFALVLHIYVFCLLFIVVWSHPEEIIEIKLVFERLFFDVGSPQAFVQELIHRYENGFSQDRFSNLIRLDGEFRRWVWLPTLLGLLVIYVGAFGHYIGTIFIKRVDLVKSTQINTSAAFKRFHDRVKKEQSE